MSRRQNSVLLLKTWHRIFRPLFFLVVLLKIETEEDLSVRKGNAEKEELRKRMEKERKRMEKERKGGKGRHICGLGLLFDQMGF